MANIFPPAGSGGLPRISTRAFQLVDAGYSVWSAFTIALQEYVDALVHYYGSQAAITMGRIGF